MLNLTKSEMEHLFQNLKDFWKKFTPEDELTYFKPSFTEKCYVLYSRDKQYLVNIAELTDSTNMVIIHLLQKKKGEKSYREDVVFFTSKDFLDLNTMYYFVYDNNIKYSYYFPTKEFSPATFSPKFLNLERIS